MDEEGDTGYSGPAIDAVADVAPVSGYKNWVLNNYSWETAWQTNLTASTVIATNGLPNGLNYVYGLAPTTSVNSKEKSFEIVSFEPGKADHVIKMRSPVKMDSVPRGLVVQKTVAIGSRWQKVVPTRGEPVEEKSGTWLNTFKVPKDGAAFFRLALDE
ncbi:MAG: hypothetical protein II649_06645 [Kiritimatiellae bacterium]|nr:hypothetical protein [Kiritimatiellia bacterium]